jgi:hypothetical protein
MTEGPRPEPGGVPPAPPTATPARRLGCWGIGLITCGSLFLIFAVFFGVVAWFGRPYFRQVMRTGVEMGKCQQQLLAIHGALKRYETRHGEYPQRLAALSPTFIRQRSLLHCPADPSPGDTISYEYSRPESDDARGAVDGEATLLTCQHHQIQVAGRRALYVLRLRRDGTVTRETAVADLTPGTAEP